MINLTPMTQRYFELFGKKPKFQDDEPMPDEKTADCIDYCIAKKMTTEELHEASKVKNHCNVWDYIMEENLNEPSTCKYGDREK